MPAPSSLTIKTSSVGRLIKEENSYHKELDSAKKNLDKILGVGEPDEYEVRQQRNVVEQTKAMIPAVRTRLQAAMEILELELINTKAEPRDNETSETKKKAQKAVDDAKTLLGEKLE